ncbi:Fucose 4-O-acetylase [Photobacterium marinum]|uniref:Fucose 4-O-acetylase n=1 Tax=Photobacterium marinum TaxID=1056511 RepID=L8JK38_9GAMM|nr:acyltransferase family protein [Photobacterium marinum]ELR67859.1 Fucose 4-O-acetylase [Photobacterium marinum]
MKNSRITSLDLGRFLAIIAVIIIHCAPLQVEPLIGDQPWLGMLLNQLSRFAVPLFFIISGYFLMPKLVGEPVETLKKYSAPLLKIWLAWSVIYLVIPFNLGTVVEESYLAERMGYWDYLLSAPLNTLFEGGIVHLWFIPGLICGTAINAMLCHYKQAHIALPLAVILYVYGLMAGSYHPVFGLEAPIFTRNGPFFSTLMIAIGFEVRFRNISVSTAKAAYMLLAGMLFHLYEAYYLVSYDMFFVEHDFLVGTPLWTTGIFFLLLNKPQLGNTPRLTRLSKDILGIYLCHLMIFIYLANIFTILELEGILIDIISVPLTFIISLLLTRLLSKTPLKHVLLR